jgi:hypothetical protein
MYFLGIGSKGLARLYVLKTCLSTLNPHHSHAAKVSPQNKKSQFGAK